MIDEMNGETQRDAGEANTPVNKGSDELSWGECPDRWESGGDGSEDAWGDREIMNEIIRVRDGDSRCACDEGGLGYRTVDGVDKETMLLALGRKSPSNLKRLSLLCAVWSECADMGAPVSQPISPCSKRMLVNFGTEDKGRSVIELAERCGVIVKSGKRKTNEYLWNNKAVAVLKELAAERGVVWPRVSYHKRVSGRLPVLTDDVRFRISSTQAYLGPYGTLDDKTVLAGVYRDCPQIRRYQAMVDEYNRSALVRKCPFFGMSFEPSVSRSKQGRVSKIGIRVTSPFALSRSSEKAMSRKGFSWACHDVQQVSRESMLDAAFGFMNWESFDVRASVPRVTDALNKGRWNGDCEFDYYEAMFRDVYPGLGRSDWKRLFMPIYFSPSSRRMRSDLVGKGFDKAASVQLEKFCERGLDAVLKSLGRVYGSEVFLHESCIYLGAIDRLRKKGFGVGLVYDAFYFALEGGPSRDDVLQAIADSFDDYYRTYIVPEDANART